MEEERRKAAEKYEEEKAARMELKRLADERQKARVAAIEAENAVAASRAAEARSKSGHTGTWRMHDDDCLCRDYCNRGGGTWTCCHAAKYETVCSGPGTVHPSSPYA